eukprot:5804277-Pleurochrysis_carterae.AAC.1
MPTASSHSLDPRAAGPQRSCRRQPSRPPPPPPPPPPRQPNPRLWTHRVQTSFRRRLRRPSLTTFGASWRPTPARRSLFDRALPRAACAQKRPRQ